jgi:hypothetical protein
MNECALATRLGLRIAAREVVKPFPCMVSKATNNRANMEHSAFLFPNLSSERLLGIASILFIHLSLTKCLQSGIDDVFGDRRKPAEE